MWLISIRMYTGTSIIFLWPGHAHALSKAEKDDRLPETGSLAPWLQSLGAHLHGMNTSPQGASAFIIAAHHVLVFERAYFFVVFWLRQPKMVDEPSVYGLMLNSSHCCAPENWIKSISESPSPSAAN